MKLWPDNLHSECSFSLPLMDTAGAFPIVVPILYKLAAGVSLLNSEDKRRKNRKNNLAVKGITG